MPRQAVPMPASQTRGPCCSPQRGGTVVESTTAVEHRRPAAGAPTAVGSLLDLSGGTFRMGSDEERYPDDGEGPSRPVHVDRFRMAAHTVRNDEFARFAAATGYVTTAEREGWSFVFAGLLPEDFPATRAVV